LATGVLAGPKWQIEGSNTWLQAGVLGQIQYSGVENAADSDDIYLRRGRIILSGQVTDGAMFFAETDNDNAGKSGQAAVSTDIQDIFADVRLLKADVGEQWIKGGLILLPFSFENRSGAGSLLGLDYNTEVIKLVNTFVWRDYGAEVHGNAGKRFSYAAGVFDGYDAKDSDKNPDAPMRLTGHASINLLGEAENGWFFNQERLGKKGNYLSLGAGFDTQDEATFRLTPTTNGIPGNRVVQDSDNWVVDFQSGFALDPVLITLNGGYYEWDNSAFKGSTRFVEGGVMFEKTQLTMKCAVQDPEKDETITDGTVGLNYFLKGHNARCGIEYRSGDSPDTILAGIQFLL